MKPASPDQNLTVLHQPYGEHHPYEPLPAERSPRDPSAGEPVNLGIETAPASVAEAVWCIWHSDQRPEPQRVAAVKTSSTASSDLWQAQLPPFSGGERVHYHFAAQSGAQQMESEAFSFTTAAWVDATSVVAVEEHAEQLAVTLATAQPGLFVRLEAQPEPEGTITLRLKAFTAAPGPALETPRRSVTAQWGGSCLTIEGQPAQLKFFRESDSLSLQSAGPIQMLVDAAGEISRCRLGFESPSDEAFYGFGERFNALDQRGNQLDNYVYAQYTGQGKRSYIPIPFFLSSRGYGMWLATNRQAYFDLAAADPDCWTVTGLVEEDAGLEVRFFLQPHPQSIVRAFTSLTGKPQLPPSWAFGLWMSSNDWNSQAEINRQMSLAREHDIPATVLVIEAWSDETNFYIWNDAQYAKKPSSQAYRYTDFSYPADGLWPDPKAMADALHAAGLQLVLWQIPVMKFSNPAESYDQAQKEADQAYAVQEKYVVQKADGSPHRIEPHSAWFANSMVFDFSNPAAAEWWFKKHEYLLTEMGVDGFKTDGAEHFWDPEIRFHNGLRGGQGINLYPVFYEGAYDRFIKEHCGKNAILFSRAGYTGGQQVSTHWLGDEKSTWDAFRASVRAMLNVGLCGISFMGWDIAGFAGPIPGSELYLRATAFSTFCPIMQYHSDGNARRVPSRDRTPWNIQEQTGDASVIPTFRTFANVRMNLMPYLLGQAFESSQTGLPLMRPLLLEYPADKKIRDFPYQYLFGNALLVAPVMEEGAQGWRVYLPEGLWRDFWTGEELEGARILEIDVPQERIPVFQKQGSILALNLGPSGQVGSSVGNHTRRFSHLNLRIFPGETVETRIYANAGDIPDTVLVETNEAEKTLAIQLPAMAQSIDLVVYTARPVAILLNGQDLPRNEAEDKTPASAAWVWRPEAKEVRIHLPESPQGARIVIRNQ